MAAKKKQKAMVLHEEGATAPTVAPAAASPPALFVVLKPGKASEGRMSQGILVTDKEADKMGKSNVNSVMEVVKVSAMFPMIKSAAKSNPQPDNLSADSICKDIKVTLDNNNMWNEFFRCKTEMILTKQGSRMFPYCRFRISGLDPSKRYSLILDIQPVDNHRYKWTGQSWQVDGKAERHEKSKPFAHPESPSTGQHWMQNPVSFYKLKLTNNIADQEGNIFLHAMHSYLPRLHVVLSDKATKDINLNGPHVITFTFPQTEFIAVIAYQNSRFAQLKVDYNPFAKGLKEDGPSSWALKLKSIPGKDPQKEEATTSKEQNPVKKSLKSLLANHKPRNTKVVDKNTPTNDFQKTLPDKNLSTFKSTEEHCRSNTRPTQKLFSELIREAHVSLKRCNMGEVRTNNNTACKVKPNDIKSQIVKSKGKDGTGKNNLSQKTQPETLSAQAAEKIVTKNNVMRSSQESKNHLSSSPCTDPAKKTCAVVNDNSVHEPSPKAPFNSSVKSDHKSVSEAQPEEKVKPHRRPAPLPLPALAQFLKQHGKPRRVRDKPKSPLALPSESPLALSHATGPPADPVIDLNSEPTGPSKDPTDLITKPGSKASNHADSDLDCVHQVSNVIGQVAESCGKASSPIGQATVPTTNHLKPRTDSPVFVPVLENPVPEPLVSDSPPVLPNIVSPNTDQSFHGRESNIPTIPSQSSTSSESPTSPPFPNTVLPVPKLQKSEHPTETTIFSQSFNQQSHCSVTVDYAKDPQAQISSPTITKPASLLSDSESSPFGFEPLSPSCSPDPLPSLPFSLELETSPARTVPTSSADSCGLLPASEGPARPSLKWHTVLPPPDPFLTTYTSFQAAPQPAPLSYTSPLLHTQAPRPSMSLSLPHTSPQALDTATSSFPSDPVASFQDHDQSLPFPAALSPLALPLSLSPTFSSLDGDPLSPTPSISELVHFFSSNDDLGMEVDFPNTEATPVPGPPPGIVAASTQGHSPQPQPTSANKPQKRKKKTRRGKRPKTDEALMTGDPTDTSMHPNLEEVEEQLFVSFTSKEALKLHLGDTSESPGMTAQAQRTSVVQPQQSTEMANNVESPESLEERIAAFEKVLLRDLKLMKHRQVIHPVLQEVGLKMNLLDPTQAIDLQYLGVRLPIPPPGESLEPVAEALVPSQSVSVAFVSRTGKTTDVTQIKGWRDKFAPSESSSSSTLSSFKPEAASSADVTTKNLSAFCSDMLDEYLENEGKLIDERAASFSQAAVEPVAYELPTKSTSYVLTLDSVLKKQSLASPTSALISEFVPPSKRPKLPPMGPKKLRKGEKRKKLPGSKQNKLQPGSSVTPISEPAPTPSLTLASTPALKQDSAKPPSFIKTMNTQLFTPPSDYTAPITDIPKDPALKKKKLNAKALETPILKPPSHVNSMKLETTIPPSDHTAPITHIPKDPTLKKKNKLKAKASSQTKGSSTSILPQLDVSEDMAPLESDSDLMAAEQETSPKPPVNPLVTKALLKQKDLEDAVVWEGKPKTCITMERAAVALTSLFTLAGFVRENPTAPIQLMKRRAPPCLNDFCRLGCVCASLAHSFRITHCGKTECIFGCSCLRQKVVLLKNLEGPDSSTSEDSSSKRKKRRKRRMRMAYTLKETASVSQPVQRVRTLWKPRYGDRDLEPVHAPEPVFLPWTSEIDVEDETCARARGYEGRKTEKHNRPTEKDLGIQSQEAQPKAVKSKDDSLKKTKLKSSNPPENAVKEPEPPAEPVRTPSKRLEIVSACRWRSAMDRTYILRKVCEAMARNELKKPFSVKNYLVTPLCQFTKYEGDNLCCYYKVHISHPELAPVTSSNPTGLEQKDGMGEEEKKKEGASEVGGEEGRLEDWQREIEEDDIPEEDTVVELPAMQEDDGEEESRKESKPMREKQRLMMHMGLPLITGIASAGFLTANRKQPGGTDKELVQVNGKHYPFAKIQLGAMGALHPANRLAAYLTGRVRPGRKLQAPYKASSSSKPPEQPSVSLSSGPTSQTLSSAAATSVATTVTTTKPKVTVLSVSKPSVLMVNTAHSVTNQIGSTSIQPSPTPPGPATALLRTMGQKVAEPTGTVAGGGGGGAPQGQASGAVHQVVTTIFPPSQGGANSHRVLPAASGSSAPTSDSKLVTIVKGTNVHNPNVLMLPILGSGSAAPVRCPAAQPLGPLMVSQKEVLQPVRSASGNMLYRKPSGQLVQLVPLSQLRALNPNLVFKTGCNQLPTTAACSTTSPTASTRTIPVSALQGPAVSIVNQTQPLATTTTTSAPVPRIQFLSGTFTTTTPLEPASSFLGQGMCTFKIIPNTGNKEPIFITCPKVPTQPPVKVVPTPGSLTPLLLPNPALASPMPSGAQGTGPGVKMVTVSTDAAGSGTEAVDLSMVVSSNPSQAMTPAPTTQITAGASDRPLPQLSPTPVGPVIPAAQPVAGGRTTPSPHSFTDVSEPVSPVPAAGIVDLDIVCVVDEETEKKEVDVVDLVGESSEETENSSDYSEESDNNSGKDFAKHFNRKIHNALEKQRRGELNKTFHKLRKEVGLADVKTPKRQILGTACLEIEALKKANRKLKERKKLLRKERAAHITAISQGTGEMCEVIHQKVQRIISSEKQAESIEDEAPVTCSLSGPGEERLRPGRTRRKPPVDEEVVEVVDLLGDTDEQTDNSSDEETAVAKRDTVINISDDDDDSDVECVDVETVDECSLMLLAEQRLTTMKRRLGLNESERRQCEELSTQFEGLRAVLNLHHSWPKYFVMEQALKEIQQLKETCDKLEKQKIILTNERTAYIKQISTRSGKREDHILRKLQNICATMKRLEEQQGKCSPSAAQGPSGATNTPTPSTPPRLDSQPQSSLQTQSQPLPQSKPSPKHQQASLTSTKAPVAVASPQQSPTKDGGVVVHRPILAPPTPSHDASGVRDRPKTIPNILSRRKEQLLPHLCSPPSLHQTEPVKDSPSVPTALVSTEVLSLVGAMLPGQQVITMNPLQLGSSMLQTSHTPGVASVTISLPAMPHQPIKVIGPPLSLSQPQPGKIYTTLLTAPATNLTACNFPRVLNLVQPPPPSQQQQQQQPAVSSGFKTLGQVLTPTKSLNKTQVFPTQTLPQPQVPVKAQEPVPGQRETQAVSQSHFQTPGPSTPSTQGQMTGLGAGLPEAGSLEDEEMEEAFMSDYILGSSHVVEVSTTPQEKEEGEREEDADDENLTRILNEIVLLNQQICDADEDGDTLSALPSKPHSKLGEEDAKGGEEREVVRNGDDERSLSPLFLELDEDLVGSTAEKDIALNNGQTQPQRHIQPLAQTQSNLQTQQQTESHLQTDSGLDSCSTSPSINGHIPLQTTQYTAKSGALTLPPLKVGGGVANMVESTNEAAGERETGVSWRPMPRLVPLGLKSNPQT